MPNYFPNKDKQRQRLIDFLDMNKELKPLLNSTEDYEKFEKAVDGCFNHYVARKSPVVYGSERFRKRYMIYGNYKVKDFQRAALWFKLYYGIRKDNPLSKKDIALRESKSSQLIGLNVDYVAEVLKKYHKRDIWYGTI